MLRRACAICIARRPRARFAAGRRAELVARAARHAARRHDPRRDDDRRARQRVARRARHGARRQDRDASRRASAQRGRSATYDLGAATLLPGLIDAHVHPGLVHQPAGRAAQRPRRRHAGAVGAGARRESVRDAHGGLHDDPEPRRPGRSRSARRRGSLADSRAAHSHVDRADQQSESHARLAARRRARAQGARRRRHQAVRVGGTQGGGEQTLSDEQLGAICGEAKAQGLRSVVHAISAGSVRAATLAGCTEIEHGTFATDAELKLMAEHGTIFDPQVCLVFQNYVDHREVYAQVGLHRADVSEFHRRAARGDARCSSARSRRRG